MKKMAPAGTVPTIIDLRQEKLYQTDDMTISIYEFLVEEEISFLVGYLSDRSRYFAA
ncbi:hypothetical protein [Cesiribacter sp. SM1]|uniref:hypothetical protein n=1 Tax=Cesiribacter sp. SM1 TaxID=2861196 RepID=UPI001CD29F36|nr:hypothetical protein [Cesiribacter sp. SM1]